MDQEVTAQAKYLPVSPRKLRLYTRGLSGQSPQAAIRRLQFSFGHHKAIVIKLLKQAVANATHNHHLLENNLTIKSIEVGDGPRLKRMDKSHGARFDRGLIEKRQSHIKLKLTAKATATATIKEK